MKPWVIFFLASILTVILLSCQDNSLAPVTSRSRIEDSTSYNEAYRDSIVALVWDAIVIMYKDGTGLRRIADIPAAASVTWSPKKWKIIYSTSFEICIMNPDGTGRQTLSRAAGRIGYAICSPDGMQIAYIAKDTADAHLTRGWVRIMNADGSSDRKVTPLQPNPHRVSWTVDSKSVVFNGEDSMTTGIFMISTEGTNLRSLYYGKILSPLLSPGGALLAFSPVFGLTPKLWTMDVNNRQLTQLTTGSSYDIGWSWSPDGGKLLYMRDESIGPSQWIGPSIWCIDRTGTNNTRLTTISQGVYSPCWQN